MGADEERFPIQWGWESGSLERGLTAVLRVKDEAQNLPHVLPPLLRAVRYVKLVDNGSVDGSADVARGLASELGASNRLDVVTYPFSVSRCGAEHLATPPDSVHSLTYFNRWAFSGVRTTGVLKWDGDMLLTSEGEQLVRQVGWRMFGDRWTVRLPFHPVYLAASGSAWVDCGLRHAEAFGWPNAPGFDFGKGIDWEIQLHPTDVRRMTLPAGLCFEVKRLDANEFDHWSDRSFRHARKQRELAVFERLNSAEMPDHLVAIDATSEAEVIATLWELRTTQWRLIESGRTAADPA